MEFSVLNKQTIQCIMTEAEVADYGMDKKAIYQNDERVREFFRRIMRRAVLETGFQKERGDIAVHAAFLSDESLEITFSIGLQNSPQEGACEDVSDEENERNNANVRSNENMDEVKGKAKKEESNEKEQNASEFDMSNITVAIFKSKDLMTMTEFCQRAPKQLQTCLYKYNSTYFILADIRSYGVYKTAVLFHLADEYMDGVCYTKGIEVFIREHGTCMIKDNAISVLGAL